MHRYHPSVPKDTPQLLRRSDIARLLNVSNERARQITNGDDFPRPVNADPHRAWSRKEVEWLDGGRELVGREAVAEALHRSPRCFPSKPNGAVPRHTREAALDVGQDVPLVWMLSRPLGDPALFSRIEGARVLPDVLPQPSGRAGSPKPIVHPNAAQHRRNSGHRGLVLPLSQFWIVASDTSISRAAVA